MSKTKAILCTVLLVVVIFGALFALVLINEVGITIFHCISSWMFGVWMADRVMDFYKWLRKKV